MIRIAIVEDENEYVQILYSYLKKYEEINGSSFLISTFKDGLDIASEYTANYDIILLDIQMKHMDGMQAAKEIRKMDQDVIFIFITSTVQFAVQGYLVDALGYVLKPVPYIAFSQILTKAIKQLEKKTEKFYLTIDVEGGKMKLDIGQILYLESQKHNVFIHADNGDYLTRGPLKRMEDILSLQGFSKCHNAYLVNLKHVTGIVKNFVLLTKNIELPISRARKKDFLDGLTDYLGGIKR